METDQYIPLSKCVDGYLYIISARNADIGVYIAKDRWFKISRFKFKSNFIDTEDHWDTGENFGTAKPLLKLNYLGSMKDDILLPRLNAYMKELYYDIKKLKNIITVPIMLIDSDRMKRLRAFKGGS